MAVLFADLSGFTQLSSTLDPEEVHRLLTRYFELADTVIAQFGGTIDKHIGDAVMGVFGAPIAHGDDTLRSLRAAGEIHAAMAVLTREFGRPVAAHVGIASGEVVAAETGSAAHRTYTVTGDAVNLASRMDEFARAGETVIADDVYRPLAHIIDAQSLGTIPIRGLGRDLPVWKLRALRAPATAGAMIGRASELARYGALLERVTTERSGATVLVCADPGMGKTRLAEAFLTMAAQAGYRSHAAAVLDFGAAQGRDAVHVIYCNLLGLDADANAAARRGALDQAIADGDIGIDDEPFAADLLAVPPRAQARYEAMDNATRTEGKLRILAASVARATARQPLVLLVEDVHWASPWVIACLAEWSRCVPQLRCALVMTSRREGDPVTPAWQREGLVRFDLPPLATDEALALASSYLAANPDVARRCVERAQGNPLFLTQLLRSDADGVAIPGTIQSVVLARLDRLPPSDKAALQAASVIGQRFGREVLRHLLADSRYDEANLVARDLIRRDGDDGRMMFVHALIRDGAYASLLHSVRRALHLRAADWYAGRDATLRAEHLDRAADPRAAAAYLEAARGEAAALRFDDALRLLRRGVELPATPDVGHDLARFEGDVARDTGDSAGSIAAFERALAHATTDARRSAAHLGIAAAHRATGDAAAGLAVLDRIEPLAAAAGLVREMAHAAYLRGCFEFARGDARASQAAQERALAHARAAGDAEGEAKALSGLADVLYADGRMRASFAAFGQCVALCDREGFARLALSNRCMLAIAHSYLEPANGALAELDRVRAVAGALRHRAAEVMADECAGWVYVIQGRFDEAIAPTERSLALARAIGSRRFVVFDLELLTFAYWHTGRHSDAAAALNEVVALSQDVGHRFIGVGVHGARALMAQSAAEVAAICAEGERSLEDGSPAHSHFWFRSQAIDASLAHGAWDGALRHATALEGFTRVEAVPWVEFQVARARALASAGRGQPDFAALRACRERGVALHLPGALPALDAALASSG